MAKKPVTKSKQAKAAPAVKAKAPVKHSALNCDVPHEKHPTMNCDKPQVA